MGSTGCLVLFFVVVVVPYVFFGRVVPILSSTRHPEEQTVRLKIHHGGMFIYKPFNVHINGQIVEEEWGWNVDIMSYIDFMKLINSLGYKSFKCLWYRDPQKALSRGLKPLNCDFNILQLAEDVFGFDVVEVYVDQEVDEQGLVEVQVQGEDEAGVVGEMEVVVEGVMEDYVEAEEDDDDTSGCSEVLDSDFEESWDWTKSLDPQTFSRSSRPTFETNEVGLTNSDFDDEDGYSDELDTPDESDDEGPPKVRFPHFKVPENDEDVKFKLKALIAYAVEKWGFILTMDQAYIAKVRAMEKIEGATRDQYKHLRSYVAEIIEKNKNNPLKIKCDLTPHGPVFERIYVWLETCKSAFATTCRPLIGLDGYFLKGEYGG
ncbi:hypothetical protein GmHk_02G003885 [Glycine max]|nr:hypothetical protein GmHk_02G003885 [Glycine max]